MAKVLMKGAEVFGEAAIKAGCRHFFGYPITPQNEIPEYMSAHLHEYGGVYVQGESEVASINMVLGAAAAGAQVMTSSSSPGVSLMSEGLSYLAGSELPCVIVNVMRGGPGLGGILPAQGDYNQACHGGAHGDFHLFVYAPSTLQEVVDVVQKSWDIAFKYRTPVMILADGFMGQMMEPVEILEHVTDKGNYKDWALGYYDERGGKRTLLKSLFLAAGPLEDHNIKLQAKYKAMEEDAEWEEYCMDDATLALTGFGTVARIAKTAVDQLRAEGLKVGLIRPKTLFPFPAKPYENLPSSVEKILCVEMNFGQMLVDVQVATQCRLPISFYGRAGGFAPTVEEIVEQSKKLL